MAKEVEVIPEVEHPVLIEVEQWYRDHFFNLGPQLDTQIGNLLFAYKEELKSRLKQLV